MSEGKTFPTGSGTSPVETVLLTSHPALPGVFITLCPGCKAPRCVRREVSVCALLHGDVHWRDFHKVVCRYAGHVVTAQGRPALRCLRCHAPRGEVVC